jgi:hypothetical protein
MEDMKDERIQRVRLFIGECISLAFKSLPPLFSTWLLLIRDMTLGVQNSLQIRSRELPREFWPLLRARRNQRRALRRKAKRKQKALEAGSHESTFDNAASSTVEPIDPVLLEAAIAAQLESRRILNEAFESGMRIVVDCSFSTASGDREIRSLVRQLQYCLAANRRAPRPAQLVYCGFSGAVQEFGESRMGANGWKAHLHEAPVHEVIPKDAKVVVMSPDAEEVLDTVDPDTVGF